MTIDFESLSGIPPEYIKRLKLYYTIFRRYVFLEQFEHDEDIHQLIIDINNYCQENNIIGYHFTNGIENDFLEKGILIRTGTEIRQDFIKRYFHLFSNKEQAQILNKWEQEFDDKDKEVRDNRVFFNFTRAALKNGGAELLLKYYGGEQIYRPLYKIPKIGEKLEKIGIPMILKCTLNPKDIKTFKPYPWGRIAASGYHRIINPKAHVEDQDGSQKVGVSPMNIEIVLHYQ